MSKLLKDMSTEEFVDIMDKVAIHLRAILPVDADFFLAVMNSNQDTSYVHSFANDERFNAPEYLRRAAASLEKENK